MPIVISKEIPAFKTLEEENIFVMPENRAINQDIRPLEVVVLNLMPTKIETETQLLRLLSNTPLQVNVTFINTESYQSKNISNNHLKKFYKYFSEIKDRKFDGMIITGAPVETMDFESVSYWDEIKEIMDFSKKNVTSTIYICWAALAGLYYHHGIKKVNLEKKIFGVFEQKKAVKFEKLLNGIDDTFYIPHSRYGAVLKEELYNCSDLVPLCENDTLGPSILKSKDNKEVYILGHLEYDKYTLKLEYERDLAKGLTIEAPCNYFDDQGKVNVKWRSTANILYSNWLNYFVYQVTPFNL